jgi:hypothetical protein
VPQKADFWFPKKNGKSKLISVRAYSYQINTTRRSIRDYINRELDLINSRRAMETRIWRRQRSNGRNLILDFVGLKTLAEYKYLLVIFQVIFFGSSFFVVIRRTSIDPA